MNAEQAFNDLGIDAITGVELMDRLQLSVEELIIPQRFHRLRDVINYFKHLPEDTRSFLLNKTLTGKNVDKLDHVWGYTQLLSTKRDTETSLQGIERELSAVESDETLKVEVAQRHKTVRERLERLKEEISIYE